MIPSRSTAPVIDHAAAHCVLQVLINASLTLLFCLYRPFVWRNQVFLGHWMAYQPAQERMALSYLNLTAGKVELVHRFSTLSSEIEQTAAPLEPPAKLTLRRSLRLLGNTALEQPAFRYSIRDALRCAKQRYLGMIRDLRTQVKVRTGSVCWHASWCNGLAPAAVAKGSR